MNRETTRRREARRRPATRSLRLVPAAVIGALAAASVQAAPGTPPVNDAPTAEYRAWIEDMKLAERGPFARIRWFCADGSVKPPEPFACAEHGGGRQHGQWSERTETLRRQGYQVATVYAALDEQALLDRPDASSRLAQMLIEQYLIRSDDGWILRRARFYRGAFQQEGEERGKAALLVAMASRDRWVTTHFLPLRIAAASLDRGRNTASAARIRQDSAALADAEPGFVPLRNKIHARLEPADAAAVRRFAAALPEEEAASFTDLASRIEALYATNLDEVLAGLAERLADYPALAGSLGRQRAELAAYGEPFARYIVTAKILAELREAVTGVVEPALRVQLIDTSLVTEAAHFTAGSALAADFAGMSRREQLMLLRAGGEAAYGAGLIGQRQREELVRMIRKVAGASVTLDDYRATVDSFALLPSWGIQRLNFHFQQAMDRLTEIEPRAGLFIQDQLRGGVLFLVAKVADNLRADANRMAGVRLRIFGREVGAGVRVLNAGLARGPLYDATGARTPELAAAGIHLLPETVADLPPVAGILTAGEGNPLSHVQLLARNLGIPNLAVEGDVLEAVRERVGEDVVLAVSPKGSVLLDGDAPRFAEYFVVASTAPSRLIGVNEAKLDLEFRDFVTLSELTAADSGRIVGPKAAKLGELKSHYPDAVAEGLAIPFGEFRALLAQPAYPDGPTMFEWMRGEYRRLEGLASGSDARREATAALRERVFEWVSTADPGEAFRERLRARLREVFGADGTYGVFVRSDTNVEDLPGFTGAGLNLTVPNVVGEDAIIEAVSRVWASPFTARAFAWRQSHMDQPEHVYPAVLLMRSVDVDKSGVLVTQDLDSGSRRWLSVAVNEGVGGAVDGQSAESLRIDVETGEVRLLSQATAPVRRQLTATGGVDKLPASGDDYVLDAGEIEQLIALARELPQRFPPIVNGAGTPVPADIEFGFLDGELKLFQIRPFLDSAEARTSRLLRELDTAEVDPRRVTVDLDAAP